LKEYAFAIVPSGTLGSDDARADIARYSLPTRMPFLMAAGNMPTIVLGSRQTAAAGFVERFQLGAVVDYDGPQLRSAVERICSRDVQIDIRERAARLGRYFSAQGVGEWILRSMDEGRAISNEIEELLPRRHGDYAVYVAPRVPEEIYPDFAPVFLGLNRLKNRGLKPDFVVDVGASTGIWSTTVQKLFPDSRYVLVEPLAQLYEDKHSRLKKHYPKFELVRCAISDQGGEATFQVSSDLYGSSLLTPADHRAYQSITVPVKTLDQLQQQLSITGRGILKLDIQLAEHLAIAGGKKFLESVDVVVAELTLPRLAKGAKTFSEMLQMMTDLGFRYYDDAGEWRCPLEGTLLQKDIVFVRRQMFRYEGALD
jgi:FkbM family methyltransferase